MIDISEIVLLTPVNDPESVTIQKIAQAFSIPTIISKQPHGAKLEKEPNVLDRAKHVNPTVSELVIVEIPGPDIEHDLQQKGIEVKLIDHHRYGDLDRTDLRSSLEQFLDYFEISDDELQDKGFDPLLILGVAAMDRGFVWAVQKLDVSDDDKDRMFEYYHKLLLQVEGDDRLLQEQLASKAFQEREEYNEFILVRNPDRRMGIRDALSFEVARHYGKPTTLVLDEGNVIYVQETEKALNLLQAFGGFTYGNDTCWGKEVSPGEDIVDLVMNILKD